MAKFILVTGGVVSSLGKGATAASLGRLLKSRGLTVAIQKCDPYLNFDPGTMSPLQHGEVFVTDDGAETDLDLGHYERFVDINLSKACSVTTGKIYTSILNRERKGEYLGRTVQVIPHVTNEIKDRIRRVENQSNPDVVITEIGGTVGDIESLPYLEAIRQFRNEVGRENVMYIHVTLVPYLRAADELKTKPTQHSVKELRGIGIQPDVIVCRSERAMSQGMVDKLALFCDVAKEAVVQAVDAETLYELPLMFAEQGLDQITIKRLGLQCGELDLDEWQHIVYKYKHPKKQINIALVGKYVALHDAYLSVAEALRHAGLVHDAEIKISWVDSSDLENNDIDPYLHKADGIIVPGGFGERGTEGMIRAIQYARERHIPFLGICLGMHMAVVEFARNVIGWSDANSSEFLPQGQHPVIDLLPEQKDVEDLGGTMRLGVSACRLTPDTKAAAAYQDEVIYERHRHRYELNNQYRHDLLNQGLIFSGTTVDGRLVEIVELVKHPWFVAVQFHPEFKSRPNRAHPLFRDFIGASVQRKEQKKNN